MLPARERAVQQLDACAGMIRALIGARPAGTVKWAVTCAICVPFVGVELADGVEGAALLAKALRDAAQHDHRGRGVLQAHLVAPVVVLQSMMIRSEVGCKGARCRDVG